MTTRLPESKAFCSKDPMLSVVFNCDNFARSVYNYRTEHPTDTSTLASLIAADKVFLADALQKKPQANHLPDFYKDAVAVCNK